MEKNSKLAGALAKYAINGLAAHFIDVTFFRQLIDSGDDIRPDILFKF
jgi:hypothetical protein